MRNSLRRPTRLGRAVVITAFTAVVLSGCVAVDAAPHPSPIESSVFPSPTTTTTIETTTPTATATAALDPLIQSEGHIAGSGRNGSLAVEVAPVGDQFQVSISGVSISGVSISGVSISGVSKAVASPARLTLTTIAAASGCSNALRFDTGTVAADPVQSFVRAVPWENTYEDLSMLKFAVLTPQHLSWQHACTSGDDTVVPLSWSVPTALAHLAVVDHGSRYGAHGRVVTRHGAPLRYVVASGDLLNDVAARFGLTPDELLWLTPSRSRGQDGRVYTGEQLNLDPASRGLYT